MPKLIVEDAGQKKAFRVTQGRLSVGCGADAKLALKSDGVEEHHAILLVAPEGVRVQVLAPVVIAGRVVEEGEVELPFGAALELGGASIHIAADAAAPAAVPAKAVAAKPAAPTKGAAASGATKRAGARTGGKSAPARGKARGKASAKSGAKSGGRSARGRRGAAKAKESSGGLPPAAKFGGIAVALIVAVVAFSKFGTSSAALTAMNSITGHLDAGKLEQARRVIDGIDRADLEGENRARYDSLLAQIEQREAFKAEGAERSAAMRYIDEELRSLITKQFKGDAPETPKVRLLLDLIDGFRVKFPKHASEVWATDSTYAADYAWLNETEAKYSSVTNTKAPYTLADAEYRRYFYLDSEPRRYQLVMPVVQAASSGSSDELERESLATMVTELDAEQSEYADKRLGQARNYYEDGDVARAARVLMTDIQTLTQPALIDRAASVLVGFEQAADVFRGLRQGKPSSQAEFERLLEVPRIRDFVRVNLEDEESEGDA